MHSGSKQLLAAVTMLAVLQQVPAADTGVLRFLQVPRYTAGLRYASMASLFDTDGTARGIPQSMRYGEAGIRTMVSYPWKWYRLGTAIDLKRITYTGDIGSRSYVGLGDLHGYVSIHDGPAVSGTRLTIPTGLYRQGMGGGAFAIAPFAGYTFMKKIRVAGDVVYTFKNPDDVQRGVSLGVHAAYRWHVSPQVTLRYAWPDDNPWTSVADSPSLLLTLGAAGRWTVTDTLDVYGRMMFDAWGRDERRMLAVECGVAGR